MDRRQFLTLAAGGIAATTISATHADAAARTLRVNYFDAFPPFSYRLPDGQLAGILVDALNTLIGRIPGLSLVHQGYPWGRAQELVKAGEAHALCTVPTDARREFLIFGREEVLEIDVHVFYAADHSRRDDIAAIRSVNDLKGFSQVDYIGNGFAERVFKELPIIWVPTLEAGLMRVAWARADVIVASPLVAQFEMRRLGIAGRVAHHPVNMGETSHMHFGIRKDFPFADEILANYDTSLRKAKADGTMDALISRHIS